MLSVGADGSDDDEAGDRMTGARGGGGGLGGGSINNVSSGSEGAGESVVPNVVRGGVGWCAVDGLGLIAAGRGESEGRACERERERGNVMVMAEGLQSDFLAAS